MSCLHTISRSPDSALLQSCLKVLSVGDSILFIEDGVYHGHADTELQEIPAAVTVYALREDMLARATLAKSAERVEAIDTKRFVELCCAHDKVVSWF